MSDSDDRREGTVEGDADDHRDPVTGTDPTAELAVPGPPVPPSPYALPASPEPAEQPYGGPPHEQPYGQQPYPRQPYAGPPYGQPSPYESPPQAYGSQQQPYGQPTAYGQYGIPAYGPPPGTYPPPPSNNGSAIALTVVSGIATVMCCIFSLPALVLGIVALTKQSTDPDQSRRLTRWGWIALGVAVAVSVLAVVLLFVIGASGGFDDGSYEYGDI